MVQVGSPQLGGLQAAGGGESNGKIRRLNDEIDNIRVEVSEAMTN